MSLSRPINKDQAFVDAVFQAAKKAQLDKSRAMLAEALSCLKAGSRAPLPIPSRIEAARLVEKQK